MFTHPHESSPSATMLFMIAHDRSGLERVARLFPVRTGMALADWLVVGKRADKQGASGIEKAGYGKFFLICGRIPRLTFHNLQTLGIFLGIPQWDVMAALMRRTRNDRRYIGVYVVIVTRIRVQIVESRVTACEYNTVRGKQPRNEEERRWDRWWTLKHQLPVKIQR